MLIDVQQAEEVTVIAPEGWVIYDADEGAVRAAVDRALEAGRLKIVIDLGHVTFIDSYGVGELVGSYLAVTKRGGMLKLCALAPKVSSIMEITKLMTVFEVFKTRAEALASF